MSFFDDRSRWGEFFLRLGAGATLGYAAWQHSRHLEDLVKMLQDFRVPGASLYLAWAIIFFLALAALALVLRFWEKRFAFLLTAFFVVTLITVPWTSPGAPWKDLALLGVALWWLFS